MNNLKIGITGASGLIGFHLRTFVEIQNGERLIIADRSTFQSKEALIEFVSDVDVIIHLAWQGIPDYSQAVSRFNLNLSIEFLDFILDNTNCDKIISSGSCWEYGKKQGTCIETDLVNINTYFTWAKHSLNQYLLVKCAEKDIILNWFRFFYVYGPGQRQGSLIPTLIKSIGASETPQIYTPMNKNDFVYVSDVANAVATAIDTDLPSGVYNVGSGYATSVYDICRMLEKQLLDIETISKQVL